MFQRSDAVCRRPRRGGFDLFLTANNHTLDHGPKGLRATIAHLDSIDKLHLGTYTCDSARTAELPKIVNVNGFKIGFLNYTYGTNGIEPRQGVVVDYIDKDLIAKDIEASRNAEPSSLPCAYTGATSINSCLTRLRKIWLIFLKNRVLTSSSALILM